MDKLQELIDRIEAREFSDVDEVYEAAIFIRNQEAKEKPICIRIDEPYTLPELGTIKPLMKPSAPASLVELVKKFKTGEMCEHQFIIDICKIDLSIYRPSKTEEMVGELKRFIEESRLVEEDDAGIVLKGVEQIIRKLEAQ